MKKIKVFNLYAGMGGNRKLWKNVEVTAIESNIVISGIYDDNNPDDHIIVTDAHKYLLKHYNEFDFIWSSPPCQTHSRMNKGTRHNIVRYPDMKLYEEIIFLKNFFKGKWVVENVNPYYKPLIKPYRVDRHLFWSNFVIPNMKIKRPGIYAKKRELEKWLGLECKRNVYLDGNNCECQILRNCVHPKIGLHVFNASFKDIQTRLM